MVGVIARFISRVTAKAAKSMTRWTERVPRPKPTARETGMTGTGGDETAASPTAGVSVCEVGHWKREGYHTHRIAGESRPCMMVQEVGWLSRRQTNRWRVIRIRRGVEKRVRGEDIRRIKKEEEEVRGGRIFIPAIPSKGLFP